MALFTREVRDLIEAQGFQDSASNTPVFWVGMEQLNPDFAVTVVPESGNPPNRRIGEFHSFSVRVRHTNAEEANLLLRRIFEFLQEFQGRLGSSPTWAVGRITADATPVQLGRDRGAKQGRWRVQQTYTAIARFATQP